uniref:Invertebrate defensins family profile domain-containing protein n=1 Tax=Glossina brevipalpis TaxID=37001 RepID=A0A1A9VZV7_9MUSC
MQFYNIFWSIVLLVISIISLSFANEITDQQHENQLKSYDRVTTTLIVDQKQQLANEEIFKKMEELARADLNTEVEESLNRQKRDLGLTCRIGGNDACAKRCNRRRSRRGYCNLRGICICRVKLLRAINY